MANNRIRVPGYAQKVVYTEGIEYRNFSPDLVGLQSTTGNSLFTMGNFNVTANLDTKTDKVFTSNKFSKFVSLVDMNLSISEVYDLLNQNNGVKLNLDPTEITNYALFGSFTEFIRVELEDIIMNWPASLYINPLTQSSTQFNTQFKPTVSNVIYDAVTEETQFTVSTDVIINKFSINYLKSSDLMTSLSDTSDIRNLTINYNSYVVDISGVTYEVVGFTGSTSVSDSSLSLRVRGNAFSSTTGYDIYHIRPNNTKVDKFFYSLSNFGHQLLNRYTLPKYTFKINYSTKSDMGYLIYTNESLTWPVSDGYNIDFDTTNYEDYASKLLDIGTKSDESLTGLMTRFLVSESITGFDTTPVFLDDLHEDTSGQKINKLLNIYGRSFDDLNNAIEGIKFANVVTYDKKDNTPDVYLKTLAKILGWDVVSSLLEDNLLSTFITTPESSYSGHSVGYTPLMAEAELWRRLILNTPWLWKSKGTRKAIEFLFRFIGAPNGLVSFNEYVYLAKNEVDISLFQDVLTLNGLPDDISIYPVDSFGYPRPLPNNNNQYFQAYGKWHRETGGVNSILDKLEGNNPHVGPYDGGNKYLDQFRTLIPDFSAVTISSETVTNTTTNLFTNYNFGKIDGYSGPIYTTGKTINDGFICHTVSGSVVTDTNLLSTINDCGCEDGVYESFIELYFNKTNAVCESDDTIPFKITLSPRGTSGNYFYHDGTGSTLSIDFDYKLKFQTEVLHNQFYGAYTSSCYHPVNAMERFSVDLCLDVLSGNSYQTIYQKPVFSEIGKGNLFTYLSGKTNNSGLLVAPSSAYTGINLYSGNNGIA